MTYTQTVNALDQDHDPSKLRRAIAPLGIGVLVATTGFTALGVFYEGPGGHEHAAREFFVVTGIVVVALVGVYGFLLPKAFNKQSAGGTALTLSVIAALLLLPAFWAGLPLVLGAAGALLGFAGKNARSGSKVSTAAFVIGLLASVGYIAIYVSDHLVVRGVI